MNSTLDANYLAITGTSGLGELLIYDFSFLTRRHEVFQIVRAEMELKEIS